MESKQKIHKGLIAVPTITTYKQDYHQSKVPYWLSNISRDFLLQKKKSKVPYQCQYGHYAGKGRHPREIQQQRMCQPEYPKIMQR